MTEHSSSTTLMSLSDTDKKSIGSLENEKRDLHYDVASLTTVEETSINSIVIHDAAEVAIAVISTADDPSLPVFTFRTIFLGIGLSAFGAVLATIYTFKPQNATVSQLFTLIIAYVLGEAMAAILPSRRILGYSLNPGPFNIKEHTAIVIMASTASSIAVAMEIIAALDLFYDIRLNAAVAIFQIFSTQMIGYGIAGLLRTLLVYPTYAFYPTYISIVALLQSLHFGGLLNKQRRKFFWIVFAGIFFWEWIPQYPFPLLTAISVICLADNGRHVFLRNLFGAGSSNEGLGLLSFGTSWTLITQGFPLVWPLQTQINSYIGIALGYIILTACYYSNTFNGRNLPFMSTALFDSTGATYNQSAIIDSSFNLDRNALETLGLPRYTTTYAISQLAYNVSLGSAFMFVGLWYWKDLKRAFGGLRFLKSGDQGIDDPHYEQMKKYSEVPQWWYGLLFIACLAIGIGCSYATPSGIPLLSWWVIIVFTIFSAVVSVVLGFITATTGFNISTIYAIQIIAAFMQPGKPITVMFANLYGNSASFQTLYMLQDLKLGQYTKLPPRCTFVAQMAGSIIGAIFNYTMMLTIINNNRDVLRDPIGTRVWSGWIIQQYNSASVAMGALGQDLFTFGKPYWTIPFAMFIGIFLPIPFWAIYKLAKPQSLLARTMAYINIPIVTLYVGWLPYSVNGQWWACVLIGFASQWWARTRRPQWFKKYNYLMSAALDGGSQVIMFILSFAVFGASGNAVDFPTWWGNPDPSRFSVDRCAPT